MRESIRYWLDVLWQNVQVVLIFLAVLAAIVLVRWDFTREPFPFDVLAGAITYSTAFVHVLGSYGVHMLYMPLQLTLGETRRHIFKGYMLNVVFYAMASTAAAEAVLALSGRGALFSIGLGVLLFQLTVGGVSCLVGTLYVRFKLVGMILIGLCSGVAGGWVSYSGLSGRILMGSVGFLSGGRTQAVLALLAAALLSFGGWLTYRRLRRLEARW